MDGKIGISLKSDCSSIVVSNPFKAADYGKCGCSKGKGRRFYNDLQLAPQLAPTVTTVYLVPCTPLLPLRAGGMTSGDIHGAFMTCWRGARCSVLWVLVVASAVDSNTFCLDA
jgi:hypothetical protein